MVDEWTSGIFMNKFGLAVSITDRPISYGAQINDPDFFNLLIDSGN
jgi:hypothetical protein